MLGGRARFLKRTIGLSDRRGQNLAVAGKASEEGLELERPLPQLLDGCVEVIELSELRRHRLVGSLELAQQLEALVARQDGVTRYASKTDSMLRSAPSSARSALMSPTSATYQFFAI